MAREDVKNTVFEMVARGQKRMKPSDLAKSIARSLGVDKKEVKEAIAELTSEGKLVYCYEGHNWLELPPESE